MCYNYSWNFSYDQNRLGHFIFLPLISRILSSSQSCRPTQLPTCAAFVPTLKPCSSLSATVQVSGSYILFWYAVQISLHCLSFLTEQHLINLDYASCSARTSPRLVSSPVPTPNSNPSFLSPSAHLSSVPHSPMSPKSRALFFSARCLYTNRSSPIVAS